MKMTGQRGMTVLELSIAMALLVVIMSAAFPLIDAMVSRFQTARDHYVAASLCQGRIERARGVPYSELDLFSESKMAVDDFGNTAPVKGRFRRTTTVKRDSPDEGLTTMYVKTEICSCSRGGWRVIFHPVKVGTLICHFTEECEEMSYIFTEYLE